MKFAPLLRGLALLVSSVLVAWPAIAQESREPEQTLSTVDAETLGNALEVPETLKPKVLETYDYPTPVPPLTIEAIRFNSSETISNEDLKETVTLRPGDKLSEELLRDSLEALYRREIFEHIAVDFEVHEHSVSLSFQLTPSLFVAEIHFAGSSVIDKKQLRRLSGIQIREKLSVQALLEAKRRILEGYRREGYFQAQVEVDLAERFVAPQVIVTFTISEGPPGRIKKVELIGDLPPELESLPARAQARAEDALASSDNLKAFRRELLSALRKEGYLQASADLRGVEVDPETGRTSLRLQIRVHDPVSLVFEGNSFYSADELLEPLKLDTRTVPFTLSAIKNLCRQIEKMYQAQGFLYARAESTDQGIVDNRRIYRISVSEGKRVVISQIHFSGITAISKSELLALMATRPARRFPLSIWRPGYLVKESLSSDLSLIELRYRETGYLHAEVSFTLTPKGDDSIILEIHVTEGPLQQIESLKVEWKELEMPGHSDTYGNLLGITAALKEGEPFGTNAIRTEQKRLVDLVVAHGFPNAAVDAVLRPESGEVTFVISPGKPIRVGLILIAGNTSIADDLIRRELTFASGEPLIPERLRTSEQALYSLGFFRTVSIAPEDDVLDSDVENLIVRVAERDTGSIELGTTLSTEDGAHVFGEVGQKNLGGDGEAIVLGVDGFIRSGDHLLDAGNARATFTEPKPLGYNVNWYTEAFAQYSIELLDLYNYDRVGASTSFRTRDEDPLKTSLGLSAYNERIYDVPADIILGENDIGATFYSFVSLQLDYDRRDSSFNPRSGHRALFQSRLHSDVIGSDVNFYALSLQESVYLPLAPDLVWANNIRGNYLRGYNDTEVIPLSQRISLGGRNSLRGFSLNAVGPRGRDGDIVGGDSSIVLNTELQQDFTDSMVGVVFLDVGQAFLAEEGDFQGDDPDLEDLRYSPGVGIRYRTPIGPITGDLGINPDRERGERWGRLFFSIGGAF